MRWGGRDLTISELPGRERNVAAATQNQALNALVSLYKQVLQIGIGDIGPAQRAKKPERLRGGMGVKSPLDSLT